MRLLLIEFIFEYIAQLEVQGHLWWHERAFAIGRVVMDVFVAFARLKVAKAGNGDGVEFAATRCNNAGERIQQLGHVLLVPAQLAGHFINEFAIVHFN